MGSSLGLTTATTSGVSGVPDGHYSLSGARATVVSSTSFTLSGIAGEPTVHGTYGDVTSVSDGAGGYLITSDLVIVAPSGFAAYDHGRATLDVTAGGLVKSGDLVFGTAVPEPASVAMTMLGLGGALASHAIRRRRAAKA